MNKKFKKRTTPADYLGRRTLGVAETNANTAFADSILPNQKIFTINCIDIAGILSYGGEG